jgi:serine/threonine protein kinase
MATQGPLSNHKLGNKYELGELLGYGGFGEVYKAHNIPLNRPQAIKVILEKHLSNPKYRERFRREAQTLAAMNHPHIVHIDDFELEQERAYLVMPFISGGTLYSILVKAGKLPLTVAEHYLEQICPALDYAHAQNVVHLDLKPQNLLHQNENDVLMLSDFGLAHLMEQGAVEGGTSLGLGSPLYMAPEQIIGSPQPRSDIYALGVILYQMLAGRPPFEGSAPGAVAIKHVQEPPPPLSSMRPDVPQTVVSVVEKALAKNPENRYATAGALLQDFHTAISSASTLPVRLEESQKREPADNRTMQRVEPPPPVNLPLQADHKVSTTEIRNRRRMLAKVRSFWINGVLEESLHGAALMALGLSEQRRAVANPSVANHRRLILQQQHQPASSLAPGTHITQVFDRANGELLILGEPGSGKTTLLLELTRDLLDRAQIDDTEPIPVVFNLSSWAVKRQPLNQWIIEELNAKYQIPRKIGQLWVETDQLLLLLDGLDEVAPEYLEACIDAINVYRGEHGLEPLVVCSRSAEYLKRPGQARLLQLQSAVIVQPLTFEQIEEYLTSAKEKLAGVRQAFYEDEELRELAATPLMLSMITLAYSGMPTQKFTVTGSLASRKQQVLATYVQRMLSIRQAGPHYEEQESIHWLAWLARQLGKQKQTEFFLERMQLDWLPEKLSYRLSPSIIMGLVYGVGVALVFGFFFALYPIPGPRLLLGLGCGALMGLLNFLMFVLLNGVIFEALGNRAIKKKPEQTGIPSGESRSQKLIAFLETRAVYGLIFGLLNGVLVGWLGAANGIFYESLNGGKNIIHLPNQLLSGIIYGLVNFIVIAIYFAIIGRLDIKIQPAEIVAWSWKSVRHNLGRYFVFGLLFGLIYGVILGRLYNAWVLQISIGSGIGVGMVFILALVGGFSNEMVSEKNIVTPNQGIRSSFRNSIVLGVIAGLMTGIGIGLPQGLGSGLQLGLVIGLVIGLAVGLNFWLRHGGTACILHALLRVCLWKANYAPLNYPRFLDFAVEHILLRRVGGGYIFIHRLLLEYFAALYEEVDSNEVTQ